jgi:hypothetical protein
VAVVDPLGRHTKVTTPEGWVDCSCGWTSNHPRLRSAEEQAELEDPTTPDPPEFSGDPDPDHLGVDGAWQDHIAAVIREGVV